MSRKANANSNKHATPAAVVGVGARLATVGAASVPLTPVQSLNEKQELEDEKAAMQGNKVFTVGDHTTHTGQTASAPATRRSLSGLLTVGSLPLARSSEPHLPSSRTKNGIFDDDNEVIAQTGLYPPPGIGSAPGIQGATGGAGAPTLTFEGLLEPEKPLKPPPTWKQSMWNIIKYSWLNVLLVL